MVLLLQVFHSNFQKKSEGIPITLLNHITTFERQKTQKLEEHFGFFSMHGGI